MELFLFIVSLIVVGSIVQWVGGVLSDARIGRQCQADARRFGEYQRKETERLRAEGDKTSRESKQLERRQHEFEKTTASESRKLEEQRHKLEAQAAEQVRSIERRQRAFEAQMEEKRREFEVLYKEKTAGFPWLANALAEHERMKGGELADWLTTKPHPATTAADTVREVSRQKQELIRRLKPAEYMIQYYESLFPWLAEFKEIEDESLVQVIGAPHGDGRDQVDEDEARHWLTSEEYQRLSPVERNQRALDRYCGRHRKTKWEIGRDYERYVGYRYEALGYTVSFRGILDGFEDLGRDLVAKKGSQTEIVQCKCWAADKVIHEKHVNQLFGTAVMYAIENGLLKKSPGDIGKLPAKARLVTTTKLSDTAKSFARALGVEFEEKVPLAEYPMIKCNVNPATGERIYHLPFDQQYDRVQIRNAEERYVATVAEAEGLGFRRAFRWRGDQTG